MTVFIELVTDAFEDVFSGQTISRTNTAGRRSRAGAPSVRRPVRGIEVKDDTYAFLRVVLPTGEDLPLLTSSSSTGQDTDYTNFILQSVQEARMERHQIVETFGDAYIFFFGEQPRFLDCQAFLINSQDFNWRAEWWHNYENYLRGTKLVELGARCYMFWDDIVVEGYMINATAQEQSEQPYSVNLQFKFFVTKYQNISLYNVEQFPVRASARIPEGIELTAPDSFYQLQSSYRGAAERAQGVSATSREAARVSQQLGNEFEPGRENRSITAVVRQLPPSFIQDPAIWKALISDYGIVDPYAPSTQTSGAVRSLIADNKDEFVQQSSIEPPLSAYFNGVGFQRETYDVRQVILGNERVILGQQESDDLTRDTVNALEAIGCRADDPNAIRDLGLGPNFSASWRSSSRAFTGANATARAGASVGANFTASAKASAGVSFGARADAFTGVGATAGARASTSSGVSASASAGYFANDRRTAGRGVTLGTRTGFSNLKDPLGSVYGRAETNSSRFGEDRPKYVEGTGDYGYGYGQWAAYGGVGFGQAGFGVFGGAGFGSSSREGDPGFRDPELFTYDKVKSVTLAPTIEGGKFKIKKSTNTEEGFNRFNRTRSDNTALTRGEQLGATGGEGSGSLRVGGRQSSFSFLSLEGSLESWAVNESRVNPDGSVSITKGRMWEVELGRKKRQAEGSPR